MIFICTLFLFFLKKKHRLKRAKIRTHQKKACKPFILSKTPAYFNKIIHSNRTKNLYIRLILKKSDINSYSGRNNE